MSQDCRFPHWHGWHTSWAWCPLVYHWSGQQKKNWLIEWNDSYWHTNGLTKTLLAYLLVHWHANHKTLMPLAFQLTNWYAYTWSTCANRLTSENDIYWTNWHASQTTGIVYLSAKVKVISTYHNISMKRWSSLMGVISRRAGLHMSRWHSSWFSVHT
jgi:hypothetical protein